MSDPIQHKTVVGWLIPSLLGALLGVLGWIGINIQEISRSLAVAVSRIDAHEGKITDLERRQDEGDAFSRALERRVIVIEHDKRR